MFFLICNCPDNQQNTESDPFVDKDRKEFTKKQTIRRQKTQETNIAG